MHAVTTPMAVATRVSPYEIVDLRHMRSRALGALFEEEQREWRQQLHWDYRPSVEMLRKHIDAHSLPGYVALVQGQVAGYTFFVQEDYKGLIGDLYVHEAYRQEPPPGSAAGLATLLLEQALETLTQAPGLRRIETQLIAFGTEPLEPAFLSRGFQPFPRLFMYRTLGEETANATVPGAVGRDSRSPRVSWELRRWDDSDFQAMAELIVGSYAGHLDSLLNDQYETVAGALRFLKNIVIFPGCGIFQQDASWVLIEPASKKLVGAILTSQVAPRIGHITQICLRPEWQGHALGRTLLVQAMASLTAKAFQGVSLTVTAENQRAVRLYEELQFAVLRAFTAYARNLS